MRKLLGCVLRVSPNVQSVQSLLFSSHPQLPQGFELVSMARRRKTLIQSKQANVDLLKAPAFELNQI